MKFRPKEKKKQNKFEEVWVAAFASNLNKYHIHF